MRIGSSNSTYDGYTEAQSFISDRFKKTMSMSIRRLGSTAEYYEELSTQSNALNNVFYFNKLLWHY